MKNYILALFLCFVIIVATYFVAMDTNLVNIKEVSSESICKVSEISEEEEKYIIKADIPSTGINDVDKKIDEVYNQITDEFKKEALSLDLLEDGKKFCININFNNYEYENYISFLISYSCDFGGAHPDTNITTINYDKEEKTIVNIDTLVSKNKDILEIFSKYSYENLKNEIPEDETALKNSTSSNKENFQNFVFSKNGVILFFPNYSIAPYYLGDFEITVPYDKLKL